MHNKKQTNVPTALFAFSDKPSLSLFNNWFILLESRDGFHMAVDYAVITTQWA